MPIANPYSLIGKVALVTGAGSGIGRQTAIELAALGAFVVVSDINATTAQETAGTIGVSAEAVAHDVTSAESWARLYAAITSRHARLDILVNNAGIMMSRPFAEAPLSFLQRQQSINVESIYMGMQGALPLMRAAQAAGATSPSIINISSVYGKVAGAQFAAYSASKGAVRALSKAVAFELASSGIRVNTVLPGPVATNLGADWDPPVDADGNPLAPEVAAAAWAALMPMGRLGVPEDIAPVIAFLASDAARFVTGAEFIADGGYTAA
jgi:NAD(P)-dependent dehydrogenase (short-subunit alcohol dehydrogenase family)